MARYKFTREDRQRAYNKVAATRGGERCGRGRNGRAVCLAVAPIPGMKCGLNRTNNLYACAEGGGRRSAARRRRRRRGRR